jgi:hypothetical protein
MFVFNVNHKKWLHHERSQFGRRDCGYFPDFGSQRRTLILISNGVVAFSIQDAHQVTGIFRLSPRQALRSRAVHLNCLLWTNDSGFRDKVRHNRPVTLAADNGLRRGAALWPFPVQIRAR